MTPHPLNRRAFLGASAAALSLPGAAAMARQGGAPDRFAYEITRTEAEWRARLTEKEYLILREGDTELPRSSYLWDETRAGRFCCKGCDLAVYDSRWRVPLDKGWVFFAHAVPDTVLMGIDGPQLAYGQDPDAPINMIEAHCRRCGSHLGHILLVEGQVLHCINGASLTFVPEPA